jgi:hypothetical protein
MGFRHIGVPYYSQWADPAHARRIVEVRADPCDDPLWRNFGLDDPDAYRFWARRVCGLACLKSLLDHWRLGTPSHATLLAAAIASGCYVQHPDGRVDGLLYAAFARWVGTEFGLEVDILGRHPLEELISHIACDTMVIASVSSEIRHPQHENTRQGGHLVLVTGSSDTGVWIHNPSGATGTQQDAPMALDDFRRFFANRGMVVRAPKQGPPPPTPQVEEASP